MIYRKKSRLFSLTIVVLCIFGSLFSQAPATQNIPLDTILVEIGNTHITTGDLLEKIDTLPSLQAPRFKTIDGQKQILDMMITEALFYTRALELGIDQLEEVQNAIFLSSQPVANSIYFEEHLNRVYRFDPQDIERDYQENIAVHTISPRTTILHLQTTEEGLQNVLDALQRGDDFLDIVHNLSVNPVTANQRGTVRNIRSNGFIAGIGQDSELDAHISEAILSNDIVYGPFTTETGIHFFKKIEFEPGYTRPLSEVSADIEARLRGQGEFAVYRSLLDSLFERYNVVFNQELFEQINPFQIPPEQSDVLLVQSSRPEIRITLGELANLIRTSAPRDVNLDLTSKAIQERLIRTEIDRRLLNAASSDARIIENNQDRYEMKEVRMRVILSYFNRSEINDHIEITRDELLDYYANNTDRYTIPASRSIRQFVSTDDRAAARHHREIRSLLRGRRDQTDKIVDYITKESLEGQNGGLLEHIYRNNIIPNLGIDENYNRKVFETRIGEISDIFRNVNGQIVFFYVVEEIPPRVRPLPDVENSLISIMHREKAAVLFEQVRQDLWEKYNVTTHYDKIVTAVTAEELFHVAEIAQRMGQINETIDFFDAIISDFPMTDDAYRALFMKGFVAAEHINDYNIAIDAFNELLQKFPEGELNESAQFMLEALLNNIPIDMLFGY